MLFDLEGPASVAKYRRKIKFAAKQRKMMDKGKRYKMERSELNG